MSMTKVAILPEPAGPGEITYRAIVGDRQSIGKTAGGALDALTASLPPDVTGTLVIVQQLRPDPLSTAEQQDRLQRLMGRWRAARDAGQPLLPHEQAELDSLVDVELRAASARATALLKELQP
jgi:hypothetical protein